MKELKTAVQVVEALGGLDAVCEITLANRKQAWHWHGRLGSFPAWTHHAMIEGLRGKKKGYIAPPELFNQRGRGLKNHTKRRGR